MASPNVREFNEDNFEAEVLESNTPVLVDFWAEWCGPCQMLTPIIDELADDYGDKLKVGKVNVDNAQQLAAKFGVQNIPTVILFDKGKAAETFVGLRKKADYQTAVNAALGTATA
jgi:thioredoxin 1